LNKIDKFGFIKKKVRHAKTGDVVRNSFISRSAELHHSRKIHNQQFA
jgi:hypothetical protein